MSGGKRSTAYNRDMARDQNNTKRWRPRWSIRILLIVITLICAYLACWGPTKKQGVDDVHEIAPEFSFWIVEASAPLILRVGDLNQIVGDPERNVHAYYFWFFGYVAKLPYERELPPPPITPARQIKPTS